MRSRWAAVCFVLLSGCAYLMPASWRAFRADPDDAAPAITRALDSIGVQVDRFEQAARRITTKWQSTSGGALRTRERYIINWERDPQEQSLTVYVRHEEQEQEIVEGGAAKWGTTSHDDQREDEMLDRIEKELSH
jgi:hypothetical protein